MGIPFISQNIFAIDFSVASSVAVSVNGIVAIADQGRSDNDFVNNHAAGSQPQSQNGRGQFNVDDHLHCDNVLIPSSGDFTWIFYGSLVRLNPSSYDYLYTQSEGTNSDDFLIRSGPGGFFELWRGGGVFLTSGVAIGSKLVSLAVQREGNAWRLYQSGVKVAEDSMNFNVAQTGSRINGRNTGAYDDVGLGGISMSIERVALWSQAVDISVVDAWAKTGMFTPAVSIPILTGGI